LESGRDRQGKKGRTETGCQQAQERAIPELRLTLDSQWRGQAADHAGSTSMNNHFSEPFWSKANPVLPPASLTAFPLGPEKLR